MSEINCRIGTPTATLKQDRTFIVTELCPHCEHEIEMRWDTDTLGFQAFCPACGGRIMLCDECRHTDLPSPCDYSGDTGRCHHSPPEDTLRPYVVTIEEHISQDFSIAASDIAAAMETARVQYLSGTLVVQPSQPTARLMMAQDQESHEVTEWEEF